MSRDEIDEIRRTFEVLQRQRAEALQLAKEVLVPPMIPRSGGAPARPYPDAPPPRPSLTPQQVADGWEARGDRWVEEIGRRDLVSALRLLGQTVGDRRLVEVEGLALWLVAAADRRLRAPRFVDLLASVWFLKYPPMAELTARLEHIRSEADPAMLPRWLREIGAHTTAVVRRTGPTFRQQAVEEARREWGVPASLVEGPWVEEIVRAEKPTSVEDVERLLVLADRGEDLRAPAPVTEAVRHVVRSAVGHGRQAVDGRRRIVSLLRGRIGELFGETGRPRWRDLDEQLRTLRSWVAGEFMDVIFQHVHPDGLLAHQLAPRREFWRRYGGAVERLTVYVKGGRAQLVGHPEVNRIVSELEGMVRIGTLESATAGHAMLVMELRGTGKVITVVEGNSSARVRIRPGEWTLSWKRLSYRDQVTSAEWAFERAHDQPGNWKGYVREELARYGVRETN